MLLPALADRATLTPPVGGLGREKMPLKEFTPQPKVSPNNPPLKPPNITTLPLAGSNAMLARDLARGPVPDAAVQVRPFHSHVSSRKSPFGFIPPYSIAVLVGGW